jgi:hypothetical protein
MLLNLRVPGISVDVVAGAETRIGVALRAAIADVSGLPAGRVVVRRLNTTVSLSAGANITQTLDPEFAVLSSSAELARNSTVNSADVLRTFASPGASVRRRLSRRSLQGAVVVPSPNATSACRLIRRLLLLNMTVITDVEMVVDLNDVYGTDLAVEMVAERLRNITARIPSALVSAAAAFSNAFYYITECTGSVGPLNIEEMWPDVEPDVIIGPVPLPAPVFSALPTPSPTPPPPPSSTSTATPALVLGGGAAAAAAAGLSIAAAAGIGGGVGAAALAACCICCFLYFARKRGRARCKECGKRHAHAFREGETKASSVSRDKDDSTASVGAAHRAADGAGNDAGSLDRARMWREGELGRTVMEVLDEAFREAAERDNGRKGAGKAGTAARRTLTLHDVLGDPWATVEPPQVTELDDDTLDADSRCRSCWLREHACVSCSVLVPFTLEEGRLESERCGRQVPADRMLGEGGKCAKCAAASFSVVNPLAARSPKSATGSRMALEPTSVGAAAANTSPRGNDASVSPRQGLRVTRRAMAVKTTASTPQQVPLSPSSNPGAASPPAASPGTSVSPSSPSSSPHAHLTSPVAAPGAVPDGDVAAKPRPKGKLNVRVRKTLVSATGTATKVVTAVSPEDSDAVLSTADVGNVV